jgi:Protein of unknown function (DUF4038)
LISAEARSSTRSRPSRQVKNELPIVLVSTKNAKVTTLGARIRLVNRVPLPITHFARPDGQPAQAGSDLRVSDNGRYWIKADGTAFFWMGDTAWQLFVKLDQSDANLYLADRARRGFTVIQACIITWDGNIPNAYGDPAFNGNDVSQPNEAFSIA